MVIGVWTDHLCWVGFVAVTPAQPRYIEPREMATRQQQSGSGASYQSLLELRTGHKQHSLRSREIKI